MVQNFKPLTALPPRLYSRSSIFIFQSNSDFRRQQQLLNLIYAPFWFSDKHLLSLHSPVYQSFEARLRYTTRNHLLRLRGSYNSCILRQLLLSVQPVQARPTGRCLEGNTASWISLYPFHQNEYSAFINHTIDLAEWSYFPVADDTVV